MVRRDPQHAAIGSASRRRLARLAEESGERELSARVAHPQRARPPERRARTPRVAEREARVAELRLAETYVGEALGCALEEREGALRFPAQRQPDAREERAAWRVGEELEEREGELHRRPAVRVAGRRVEPCADRRVGARVEGELVTEGARGRRAEERGGELGRGHVEGGAVARLAGEEGREAARQGTRVGCAVRGARRRAAARITRDPTTPTSTRGPARSPFGFTPRRFSFRQRDDLRRLAVLRAPLGDRAQVGEASLAVALEELEQRGRERVVDLLRRRALPGLDGRLGRLDHRRLGGRLVRGSLALLGLGGRAWLGRVRDPRRELGSGVGGPVHPLRRFRPARVDPQIEARSSGAGAGEQAPEERDERVELQRAPLSATGAGLATASYSSQ